MSTYAYAKLYLFDKDGKVKSKKEHCVNYLKTIFEMNEWPEEITFDFSLPDSELPPNVSELGFVDYKGVFEDSEHPNAKDRIILGGPDKGFIRVGGWFESYWYKEHGLIKDHLTDTERLDPNWMKIEAESSYHGEWTDRSSLFDYKEKLAREYKEHFMKYSKLQAMKESIDYFRLEDDAKDSLNDELSSEDSYCGYILDKIDTVSRFIGAIDWFYEETHEDYTDYVKAYIYVD